MADVFLPPDSHNNPYGGNGPLLMGVTWSLAIIALILMGFRTYSNAVISKHFSWDYLWAVITLVRNTHTTPPPSSPVAPCCAPSRPG